MDEATPRTLKKHKSWGMLRKAVRKGKADYDPRCFRYQLNHGTGMAGAAVAALANKSADAKGKGGEKFKSTFFMMVTYLSLCPCVF